MEHDNTAPAAQAATTHEDTPEVAAILDVIETQRTELMAVNAMLNCSRYTLLNDAMEEVSPYEHSDVVSLAARLLNAVITQLDDVQLRKTAANGQKDAA